MTATLPRTHVQMTATLESERALVTRRWHRYRRITGAAAAALGLVAGLALSWPAMIMIVVIGLAGAADASLALKNQRSRTNPTIVADIMFTGAALIVVGVPGPAVGAVVAYFVLVVAVLGDTDGAWIIGALAVVVGLAASFLPHAMGLHDQPIERSVVAGIVVVIVFGVSTIGVAHEFVRANRIGARSSGRKIEIAEAISIASRALVALEGVEGGSHVGSLGPVRLRRYAPA